MTTAASGSTALSPGDLDDIAAAYSTAFTQTRPA